MCSDAERDWFPQLRVCHHDAELARLQWEYGEVRKVRGEFHDGTRERWAKERSAAFPYHYLDGVTLWVSLEDHGEGGDFLSARPQQREREESQSE